MMQSSSILSLLRAQADQKVKDTAEAHTRALDVRGRMKKLQTARLSFTVKILSSWSDHGGQDVSLTVKGSLEQAMQEARAEFMKQNRISSESGIQGKYCVMVRLPGEPVIQVPLPESCWIHLIEKK